MRIHLVVFDIDGILTDGTILVDGQGNEQKQVSFRDFDTIVDLKQEGILIAAITGEETRLALFFKSRIQWDSFMLGRKDKADALQETMCLLNARAEETLYIGDGKYDVGALTLAGFGVCPSDACFAAKNASDIVLKTAGGKCLEELFYLIKKINSPSSEQTDYLLSRISEHVQAFQQFSINNTLAKRVMELCEAAAQTIRNGNKLLFCGNGGSAADAQHIAAEFVGRFFLERQAMNAEALTTNTSILTCLGNDYSFDTIFARQVEAKAATGDLLIGLSTSGKSQNVLKAFCAAKELDVKTALLMGDFECPESETIDYVIQVPSKLTPRIQELHIFIGHILAEYVEERTAR